MSLSYSVGSWTIVSHEVDTISTPKSLAVPDLDYSHDFSVSSEAANEVRLLNTSGTTLEPVERLRYAREKVSDIYRNTDTLRVNQLPSPIGVRILAENTEILSAANSVSGAELVFPIRVWTCIESSTHNVVTGEALLWALTRHIAQLFTTGAVSQDQLVRLFRGDLDPTR